MTLSWALCIATYNRAEVLRRALRTAIGQTRPPAQVVIVDGSDDWAQSRDAITAEGLDNDPSIGWTHEPAQVRGLTYQRNQGLSRVEADVVMLFDDDTLMYPDCAEAMMRVYETDIDGRVVGVQARRVPEPPDEPGATSLGGKRGQVARGGAVWAAVHRWFGVRRYLLPYEDEARGPLPEGLGGMGLVIAYSFRGAVMSYRAETIRSVGFEEALQRYAYLEDADASQRAARHGLLVEAEGARACHLEESSGREGRYPVIVMGGTNAMLLHRLHAADPESSRRSYRRLLGRRAWYQLAKDVKAGDLSLTGWRATREARRRCDEIFDRPTDELLPWYADYQASLWEAAR